MIGPPTSASLDQEPVARIQWGRPRPEPVGEDCVRNPYDIPPCEPASLSPALTSFIDWLAAQAAEDYAIGAGLISHEKHPPQDSVGVCS
jgi:hypothetical protein